MEILVLISAGRIGEHEELKASKLSALLITAEVDLDLQEEI